MGECDSVLPNGGCTTHAQPSCRPAQDGVELGSGDATRWKDSDKGSAQSIGSLWNRVGGSFSSSACFRWWGVHGWVVEVPLRCAALVSSHRPTTTAT